MSTILMSQCWPLSGMSPAQKAVLISLADQSNDDGVCWPSVGTISVRTCLSERAVQNAIKWLAQAGLLVAKERSGTSTVYRITPAAYAPPQEMHPAAGAPTPAAYAPPQEMHPAAGAPTPAAYAPPPPQQMHPTPAAAAPKPSLNRNLNHHGIIDGTAEASKPAKPAARATALPVDFQPDDTAQKLANDCRLNIAEQLLAFQDYHAAKGTTFKDWQAGFRTWLRNARKFDRNAQGVTPGRNTHKHAAAYATILEA
ncbi:helix-turn-helix domain-containing protein [Comamonas kerstersii]|uniref:helix-turn-helix domain-containing protein n=1 Tax=Comamonas kerstersii TaxID=225992 RepID=UPI00345DFF17